MAAAALAQTGPEQARAKDERARAPPAPAAQAPAIARKALADRGRSSLLAPDPLQLKGLVSSPDDAAARDADRIADHVVSMPDPAPRSLASAGAALQRAPVRTRRRRRRAAPPTSPAAAPVAAGGSPAASLMRSVAAAASGGSPLSRKTRAFLEPRFGADFGGVKVHTGPKAKQVSGELGARAFTYGRDIFFNQGEYQPETREGKRLLAHELTHTIQQRGVIQRKALVQQRTSPLLQRGLLDDIGGALSDAADAVGEFVGDVVQIVKDFIADKADIIPGFRLLCLILGHNPINDAPAPGGGRAILQELTTFIPFGDKVLEALTNHGIIDKGGAFIDEQLAAFKRLVSSVTGALGTFFSSLGPGDALDPGGAWDRAKSIFTTPLNNLKSFASGLVSGFVTLVREVIIKPLGKWAAANIPKWDLLMAVLGQNPISEEGESPASQIIGAFMNLIGQGEIWENIKRGKAVDRAWAWFQNALKGAKSLVAQLPGLIMSTIRSLTIMDVLTIVGAFQKIVGAFGSFASSFFTWAGTTVLDLLEIILSVVAPGAVPYLKKAGGAFSRIIKDPITFVRTLVAAGKAGFQNFAGNFLTHLKAALIGWLTGSLSGAGVYIPQGFTVLELLKFVLSVLGLTWANVRGKLVAATNESTVQALETGFQIVKTLVTEGPAAAWQEIVKTLTNLKQMAIDAVMDFVKSKIVEIAVTKLLSMLSPAGAFIQAIIAIYNTIMFFVERIRQIAAVAASFIDSIAAIASGNIGPAAARVERTLAGLLVLVISFLARLAGLGKVSDAVLGLVKKIRDPIDKALNAVVAWIVGQARRLGRFILQAGTPADPNARLRLAIRDATAIARGLGNRISRPNLERALGVVGTRYGLTRLIVAEQAGVWSATATINPTLTAQIATAPAGGPGAGTGTGAGGPAGAPATVTPLAVGMWIMKGSAYEQVIVSASVLRRQPDGRTTPISFQTVNPLGGGGIVAYSGEGTAWTRTTFVHSSKLVVPLGGGRFKLAPARAGDYIREQFYRDTAASRSAIVRSKLPGLVSAAHPGEFRSEGDPAAEALKGYTKKDPVTGRALVPVSAASPDHTPSIASHWTTQGSQNPQAARVAWNGSLTTYRIMSLALNLSLGSGGASYGQEVGINFRGPGE